MTQKKIIRHHRTKKLEKNRTKIGGSWFGSKSRKVVPEPAPEPAPAPAPAPTTLINGTCIIKSFINNSYHAENYEVEFSYKSNNILILYDINVNNLKITFNSLLFETKIYESYIENYGKAFFMKIKDHHNLLFNLIKDETKLIINRVFPNRHLSNHNHAKVWNMYVKDKKYAAKLDSNIRIINGIEWKSADPEEAAPAAPAPDSPDPAAAPDPLAPAKAPADPASTTATPGEPLAPGMGPASVNPNLNRDTPKVSPTLKGTFIYTNSKNEPDTYKFSYNSYMLILGLFSPTLSNAFKKLGFEVVSIRDKKSMLITDKNNILFNLINDSEVNSEKFESTPNDDSIAKIKTIKWNIQTNNESEPKPEAKKTEPDPESEPQPEPDPDPESEPEEPRKIIIIDQPITPLSGDKGNIYISGYFVFTADSIIKYRKNFTYSNHDLLLYIKKDSEPYDKLKKIFNDAGFTISDLANFFGIRIKDRNNILFKLLINYSIKSDINLNEINSIEWYLPDDTKYDENDENNKTPKYPDNRISGLMMNGSRRVGHIIYFNSTLIIKIDSRFIPTSFYDLFNNLKDKFAPVMEQNYDNDTTITVPDNNEELFKSLKAGITPNILKDSGLKLILY